MFAVRLETEDGRLVHQGHILPFKTVPKVVIWGARVFLFHEDTAPKDNPAAFQAAVQLGAPLIYREAFAAYCLPETK
jgi:hypothetical protein